MPLRPLHLLAVVVTCAPIAGCDLISSWFQQDIDLPVELTTPTQDVDVGAAVAQAEGSACTDPNADSCTAIKAICSTDTSRQDCDSTPSLPPEFPKNIDVAGNQVDANALMLQMGVTKATELKLALPVDVAGALSAQGVQSPDAIKNVKIVAVSMQWPENSLTFDAPPLDLYVTTDDVGETPDADALIAAGTVKKVGSVGLDVDGDGSFDIGQHARGTSDVDLEFSAGGAELLTKAFTAAKFTIVTAVPDGKGMRLGDAQDDPSKVAKPGGTAKVALHAKLAYTVSAADIVGGVPGG